MKKYHGVNVTDHGWYGYKPDSFDPRDYKFGTETLTDLPATVDLRADCPPVMDQGNLGSCTAHGITGALRHLLVKKGGPRDHRLSRLQLYFDERVVEGTSKEDAGAEIRDGIKCAAKIGVAHETLWPYTISKFAKQPNTKVYADAVKFEALTYARVAVSSASLKAALAAGNPVIVGFTVFESFESAAVEKTGVVPMPNISTEQVLGGHCVYVVGYGQQPGHFTCRNSWGVGWGMDGDFFMPKGYLGNPDFGDDYWVITSVGAVTVGTGKKLKVLAK
jgi:C1A family cysteine protease